MDRHQPAYWLSRDPAEAADFLARTAVASRVVGGFVKKADGLDPELKKHLTNAAIGAGIGGVGGLGVGLFSKRKKNPLTTALTGATLGGVLGTALPAAWNAASGAVSPEVAAAAAAQAKQHDEAWTNLGGISQAHHLIDQSQPPLSTGPAPAGTIAAPGSARDSTHAGAVVANILKDFGVGAGRWAVNASGILSNPGVAAPAYAGAYGLHRFMDRLRKNIDTYREFEAGASSLVEPAVSLATSGQQGQGRQGGQGQGGHTQTPLKPQESAARHLIGQMSDRAVNPNRMFRPLYEATLGSELNRIPGSPRPFGGVEGPTVTHLRNVGRKLMPAPTIKGKFGRIGTSLAPYLVAAILAKATEPRYP